MKILNKMSSLRIVAICKEKGIKQEDLAKMIGVKRTSLSTSIRKKRLSLASLEEIASLLKVDILDLFNDVREKEMALNCPHCGKPVKINLVK